MEIIAGIIEAIVALVTAIIEGLVSMFGLAEGTGIISGIAVLSVAIFELIFWLALFLVELLVALVNWRKPKAIKRPIFWRPKPKEVKKEK